LIDNVDKIINFSLEIEPGHVEKTQIVNYDEVKAQIIVQLALLRDKCPLISSEPLIYHVDVAAMYPNIILSNRLQPVAIVNEKICEMQLDEEEKSNQRASMNMQESQAY